MASNPFTRSSIEGNTIDGNIFTGDISLVIAAGATGYYNVSIPPARRIFTLGRDIVSNSNDGFEVRLYRGSVFLSGQAITNVNANGNSTKTSDVVIKPINITTLGTEKSFQLLPAGGFKSGGQYPQGSIKIYAPGDYQIGIKNLSNATQTVYVTYLWADVLTALDY